MTDQINNVRDIIRYISPQVKVGSTQGYLYGYYPYDSEATDVKAIPVKSHFTTYTFGVIFDVFYPVLQAQVFSRTYINWRLSHIRTPDMERR